VDVTIWSSIINANQQHPTISKALSNKLPLDLVVWVITQAFQRAKFGTISPK
jgi:hypothetical protein